jgi:hypothetical protein
MTIGRPQMDKQIRGYNQGGIADLDAFEPTESGSSSADYDSKLKEIMSLMSARSSTAPSKESIGAYEKQLRDIYGPRRERNFYDMASSVGAAMLRADPTAGAFRSLGLGLAEYNEEDRKRRAQEKAEDRAIAMKAFELAKSDEASATKMINDYALYKAKQKPDNKIAFYKVATPGGVKLAGKVYLEGEKIPLTEQEASMFRNYITEADASSGGGWKVPGGGLTATWRTAEDARKVIKGLGLSEDSVNFDSAVSQITAPSDEMVGKPIIVGGAYAELSPLVQGDDVFNVMLAASKAAGTPLMQTHAQLRIEALAKDQNRQVQVQYEVLPSIESAMELIRTDPNVKTGQLTPYVLPIRNAMSQIFNINDPYVTSLNRLDSVSNYMAPKMRTPGSGSTSNMEFDAYKQAILSMKNTEKANYISLYAFKKMAENVKRMLDKEAELLISGEFSSLPELNAELKKYDPGLFEKPPADLDLNNEQALTAWVDSLPEGAVISNPNRSIFDTEDPYVIKGWTPREVK